MSFPRLCRCGHRRHAHSNGSGPCRPCTLGGEPRPCEQYEEADLVLSFRLGKWSATRHLSPMSLDNAIDPEIILQSEIRKLIELVMEGIP